MKELTIRHTRPEGTVVEGTSRGDGSADILGAKINGVSRFRFSRNIGAGGAWYIPGSRDRAADRWTIDKVATALRAAGWVVDVVIDETPRAFVEAEKERYDRADGRADYHSAAAGRAAARSDARSDAATAIRDSYPLGQPILVGHHSEGRHRRDLARADGHERVAVEEAGKAGYHAGRAQAAGSFETGRKSLPTTLRRIKELKARSEGIKRNLAGRIIGPLTREATGWRESREADLVQLADEIAHWEKHVDERTAAGEKVWGPDDFQVGDLAGLGGGYWHLVLRVNRKSLRVESRYLDHRSGTVPYDKITGRVSRDEAGTPAPEGSS